MDEYLILNTPEVRQAIWRVVQKFDDCVKKQQVTIRGNRLICVRGRVVLNTDRHFHYPNAIDHAFALHQLLTSLEEVLKPA